MDARLRLITIPVSHYCEKGRWALDAAGLSYREDRYPPAIHRLVVARHGARTAPVLLTGTHTLRGSDRILEYATAATPAGARLLPQDAEQRAEVQRWLGLLDHRFGVDTRRWLYSQVLDDVPTFLGLLGAGLSERGRHVLARTHPVVRRAIRMAFGVGDSTRAEAEEGIHAVFAEADAARGESGYLVGDRFTAADLTFAALGAPLVGPPSYGVALPPLEQTPERFREALAGWRATASGAAILFVYERHRHDGDSRPPTPTTPGGVPR